MTSRRRFPSSPSRGRGADGQPPAQVAPSVETYIDRNEEQLDRLLCITVRDDALAPADILRAARDLRPTVEGAMPMYSRISNAERGASLYCPSISHGGDQRGPRKFFVVISSGIAPKSALGNRKMVTTCRVTTLAELPNCKLSTRANQSTEQALPLRKMPIKSCSPAVDIPGFY